MSLKLLCDQLIFTNYHAEMVITISFDKEAYAAPQRNIIFDGTRGR